MKPLSEFAEEFVESESFYEVAYQYRHAQLHDQREVVKRFEELKAHIKGELQAWLREADEWASDANKANAYGYIYAGSVRGDLLGTTQEGG